MALGKSFFNDKSTLISRFSFNSIYRVSLETLLSEVISFSLRSVFWDTLYCLKIDLVRYNFFWKIKLITLGKNSRRWRRAVIFPSCRSNFCRMVHNWISCSICCRTAKGKKSQNSLCWQCRRFKSVHWFYIYKSTTHEYKILFIC